MAQVFFVCESYSELIQIGISFPLSDLKDFCIEFTLHIMCNTVSERNNAVSNRSVCVCIYREKFREVTSFGMREQSARIFYSKMFKGKKIKQFLIVPTR